MLFILRNSEEKCMGYGVICHMVLRGDLWYVLYFQTDYKKRDVPATMIVNNSCFSTCTMLVLVPGSFVLERTSLVIFSSFLFLL